MSKKPQGPVPFSYETETVTDGGEGCSSRKLCFAAQPPVDFARKAFGVAAIGVACIVVAGIVVGACFLLWPQYPFWPDGVIVLAYIALFTAGLGGLASLIALVTLVYGWIRKKRLSLLYVFLTLSMIAIVLSLVTALAFCCFF